MCVRVIVRIPEIGLMPVNISSIVEGTQAPMGNVNRDQIFISS